MAQRKTIDQRVQDAQMELQQANNRYKRLLQEQKEQDRKARTKRLCTRAGLLEKLMPETIEPTDEQFHSFLKSAVVNDYGHRTLTRILAQGTNGETHSADNADATLTTEPKPLTTATTAAQQSKLGDTPNPQTAKPTDARPSGADSGSAAAKSNGATPQQTSARPSNGNHQTAVAKPNGGSNAPPAGGNTIRQGA